MTVRDIDSPAGRSALGLAVGARWLLAFDFDGTLAPIVTDPAAAVIPPAVSTDLAILARRRTVAVITGRSRRDVLSRLPPGIAYVVGNHGCELPGGETALLAQAIATTERWRLALAPLLARTGLRLESKGPSLALHWRGCEDAADLAGLATRLALHLDPRPHLVAGDQVLNLLLPGLPDKGVAIQHLMRISGCPGAVFIGDDITDATVFRLHFPGIMGIKVGDQGLGAEWRAADIQVVGGIIHQLVGLAATS